MNPDSLTVRTAFATLGMTGGAIVGGAIANALLGLSSADDVFQSNGIVIGACLGIGIGYGIYRALHARMTKARRLPDDESVS